MRKFVLIVGIIEAVACGILAILSFLSLNVLGGISNLFTVIYLAVFLAWLRSIDDKAEASSAAATRAKEEYQKKTDILKDALNETRRSLNKAMSEIEELQRQVAYLSGQQAGKEAASLENNKSVE